MAITKLDIVQALEGQPLTIWFVGSFRAFRSGSAPRYTSAPHYRNFGVFTVDGEGRLQTEKMEFSRHHSKISAILATSGELLYGQYCGKCKSPVPKQWSNCHRCACEIRRPLAETITRLEKLVASQSRRAVGTATDMGNAQAHVALSTEIEELSALIPREAGAATFDAARLEAARKLVEAARLLLETGETGETAATDTSADEMTDPVAVLA